MSLFNIFKSKRFLTDLPPVPTDDKVREDVQSLRMDQYSRLSEPLRRAYYDGMEKVETKWSILYNLKDFGGQRGKEYEQLCLKNIEEYKKWIEVELKYGMDIPLAVPAFKRLAMLYEKWGAYEQAAGVCKAALSLGDRSSKMDSRLIRMIKKAGRTPTEEELRLIDKG